MGFESHDGIVAGQRVWAVTYDADRLAPVVPAIEGADEIE